MESDNRLLRDLFVSLLQQKNVFMQVNPVLCIIPKHLQDQKSVILEWGLNMAKPINDLKIDETGVSGTLSYGGLQYWTMVPWEAIEQYATHSSEPAIEKRPRRQIPKGWGVIKGGKE